MNYLRKQTR